MNIEPQGDGRDVVTVHATLPGRVMALWQRGLNTAEIAAHLRVSEAGICRIISAARRTAGEGAAE